MALQFKIQESNSQITLQTGDIELYGLQCAFTTVGSVESYDLTKFRIRSFFNHHFFLSIENLDGVYAYYGVVNPQQFQGAGGIVSVGYDDWRSPVRPPRIDANKYCSEVIIYPPQVTIDSSTPSAYDGRFQLAGVYNNSIKVGKYDDIISSYSYISEIDGYIYNPLNWVIEKIDDSKTRNISSISTNGNVVTVITNSPHGYSSGTGVTITGLNSDPRYFGHSGEKYEGNFIITVTGTNSFTYKTYHTTSSPSVHTTGIVQVWEAYINEETITSIQGDGSGTIVITYANSHNFVVDDLIAIDGTVNYNEHALIVIESTPTSIVCKSLTNNSSEVETTGALKYTGRVPSAAISINYPIGYEQHIPEDHTLFTQLVYASSDTYIDNINRSNDYTTSPLISLINFTNAGNLYKRYMLYHFPIQNIPISQVQFAELGLYYDNGNDNGNVINIYQVIDPEWFNHDPCNWDTFFPSWELGDQLPPTINSLFDPSNIISTHAWESVNQIENNTYIKFNMSGNTIMNWIDGTTNPDMLCEKIFPDDSIVNSFRSTENSESKPYILISSGIVSDTIPPTITPIDTKSTFPAISAQGDGSGNVTITTSTPHNLNAGDFVTITGVYYFGVHLQVLGGIYAPSLYQFTVEIIGNTSILSDSYVYYTRYNGVDIYFRVTDVEEVSTDTVDTRVNLGESLIPLPLNNFTKVSNTTLTFDVNVNTLSDGYMEAQTTDANGNISDIITPPVLFSWYNVSTSGYNVIKPGQDIFINGLNIETPLDVNIGDSSLEGGVVNGGYTQSIAIADISQSDNGFLCNMPIRVQCEYNVLNIDSINDTLLLENCSLKVGDKLSFNTLGIYTVNPIVIGRIYVISSVVYIGANALIQISYDGVNSLDIGDEVTPVTLYAYNATTPLYVINDNYNSSDYNSIIQLYIDEFGPKIQVDPIAGVGSTVNVTISDIYPIKLSSVRFTNAIITNTPVNDVNGNGTLLVYEVIITSAGIFRVDASDINNNSTCVELPVSDGELPYIEVTSVNVTSATSAILEIRVATDGNVPSIVALDNQSAGIFVEGNIPNSTFGVISNLSESDNVITFTLTINSIGFGIMRIYATTNNLSNYILKPIVITSLTPYYLRYGSEFNVQGINLKSDDYSTTYFLNSFVKLNNISNTSISGTINGLLTDGITEFVYAAVVGSNITLSNTLTAVIDNTPPLITINNNTGFTNNVVINTSYNDPGATAIDNISGDITNRIVTNGTVNVNKLGTYYITYSAVDDCDNKSIAVRSVNVVTGCPLFIEAFPKFGYIGDTIRIECIEGEFNPIPINNIVMFNDIIGQVVGGTRTELYVTVPFGAISGYIQIETGYSNIGYTSCSLTNITPFDVLFVDEVFPATAGLSSYERDKRAKIAMSGRISPFTRGANQPALYNRDIAYTGFSEVTDENSMVQNVYSIILTRRGERLFNSEFGIGIEGLIFKIIDDPSRFEKDLLDDIVSAVSTYEPRVYINRDESFVYYEADAHDIQIILSLIVPSGNVRTIGVTLSALNNGEANI